MCFVEQPAPSTASGQERTEYETRAHTLICELFRHMTHEAIVAANNKGNNALHLCANRGNAVALECMLNELGKRSQETQNEMLNRMNEHGKSPLDVASYNTACKRIVRAWGGRSTAPPPENWRKRLADDDHRQRQRHRPRSQ